MTEKRSFLSKLGIRKARSIAESASTAHAGPKLLFMHIPKAAGSTVNTFFAKHYSENQYAIHIESNKKWESSPDKLKKLNFLSGHIRFYVFNKTLDLDNYYKVTVIREPYAQLRSHLAWIKRLAMPGEEQRLRQHSKYIQLFARKLATTDFAEPEDLQALVGSLQALVGPLAELEAQLIDNYQVRYFTWIRPGRTVDDTDAKKAIAASATFDRIGIAESIDGFMKEVASDLSWPLPNDFVRENITQDFYDLDISNSESRAALRPLVKHDLALYDFLVNLQSYPEN